MPTNAVVIERLLTNTDKYFTVILNYRKSYSLESPKTVKMLA